VQVANQKMLDRLKECGQEIISVLDAGVFNLLLPIYELRSRKALAEIAKELDQAMASSTFDTAVLSLKKSWLSSICVLAQMRKYCSSICFHTQQNTFNDPIRCSSECMRS
jgi:hypothetical protein